VDPDPGARKIFFDLTYIRYFSHEYIQLFVTSISD
jgi:hypothetical protein